MDSFSEALSLLPQKYLSAFGSDMPCAPEELRLRVGRPPSVSCGGKERFLSAPAVTEEDLIKILEKATGASLYSAAEAMRKGCFCVGTMRIGICGQAASAERGRGFSHYSSLCIRMAQECRGVCQSAADRLWQNGFENTLILSPPGGGKTTALRDLIRILADRGLRVGVVDERGELSGSGFDLGRCSDVISGLDKLSGALLLLRSMTPQIIASDEISAPNDIAAIEEIFGCGTGIMATAHAENEKDLQKRPAYRRLVEQGIFTRTLVIRRRGERRFYEAGRLV